MFICLFYFFVRLFYLMWFWLIGVHLGWLFDLLIMFELWDVLRCWVNYFGVCRLLC